MYSHMQRPNPPQAVNYMDVAHGTIHYGMDEYAQFAGCMLSSGIDLSDGYHVFVVEWEADVMRW